MTLAAFDLEDEVSPGLGWRRERPLADSWYESEQRLPAVVRTPLLRIIGQAGALRAARPLEVVVERGADLWMAENEIVHVYASGATIDEAIRDFSEQVLYFYDLYTTADESELTGLAVDLRRVYSENFDRMEAP